MYLKSSIPNWQFHKLVCLNVTIFIGRITTSLMNQVRHLECTSLVIWVFKISIHMTTRLILLPESKLFFFSLLIVYIHYRKTLVIILANLLFTIVKMLLFTIVKQEAQIMFIPSIRMSMSDWSAKYLGSMMG